VDERTGFDKSAWTADLDSRRLPARSAGEAHGWAESIPPSPPDTQKPPQGGFCVSAVWGAWTNVPGFDKSAGQPIWTAARLPAQGAGEGHGWPESIRPSQRNLVDPWPRRDPPQPTINQTGPSPSPR